MPCGVIWVYQAEAKARAKAGRENGNFEEISGSFYAWSTGW